ncbi:MAG: valine--tRNA ligase [Anaerolineae bacterium]|nr:valine--tRNA ligase [Anaerolineae bacterium]
MSLPKRYHPQTAEPGQQAGWQEQGVYYYDPAADAPRFTIDTPPPTVSGQLHLGHVYSYSQTDFIARFWRMNGRNVYYPMGYDDNGLPTERLVEKRHGIRAADGDRATFITHCLAASEEAEHDYRQLWQRLGLSVDWRYSYRTIDEHSRRLAQWSFIDLHRQGLAYRQQSPTIWCPECQTAIAQADVDDLERETTFYTLAFRLPDGATLPIATTRPELLPACVAAFVHPGDGRYQSLIGQPGNPAITTPLGQTVPLLADPAADPHKGTGAVMCCTFGDTTDVAWQKTHQLPIIEAIGRDGRLTAAAHPYTGLTVTEARQAIMETLREQGAVLTAQPIPQTVRVHERCDTPVEYVVTPQWFIRVLDYKADMLAAGEQITWQPPHMHNRYRQWVENLSWDWCISRQRFFGVPFPLWYCAACGAAILADEDELPVDPMVARPSHPCPHCHSTEFIPETDVFDTWFTSSLSPQIAGQWQHDDPLYNQVYPFTLRPQGHEIIRTWAFYTIVKSHHHFGTVPFAQVAISGWGLAAEGMGKISKSRGGGPMSPLAMIEQYSADAVRYWAASTALGKDAIISEEKIQAGAKLVNKLYNVAKFSERFLCPSPITDYRPPITDFTPADRWLLAHTTRLIQRSTFLWQQYDYATARSETEAFFWRVLADNYLEMAKMRLYAQDDAARGAVYALHHALLTALKLFAPILPHITEEIYQSLFATADGAPSIHRAQWPVADPTWLDDGALAAGELLVEVATAVRRHKSEHNLSPGAELAALYLNTDDDQTARWLPQSRADLMSITRAQEVVVNGRLPENAVIISHEPVQVAVVRNP